ncbi:MAG TPA: Yip1 family protein [Allosphingosinicella sp.]|jgi:hypothetical protein
MQDTPETPGTGGPEPTPASPTPPPPPAAASAYTGAAVGPRKGLFDRVRDILIKPAAEWPVIDAEPATVGSVFVPYALILAAIGPLAGLIGGQVFGLNFGLFSWTPPIGTAISMAVVGYVISLATVFVLALIIDALAPTFGGTKNQVNATKLAVYSWTAFWVAGIFGIIPALAILGLVGLYSFYLLHLGLPVLMRVPQDKASGYTVVVVLIAIVLYVLVSYVVYRALMGMLIGAVVPGIR